MKKAPYKNTTRVFLLTLLKNKQTSFIGDLRNDQILMKYGLSRSGENNVGPTYSICNVRILSYILQVM